MKCPNCQSELVKGKAGYLCLHCGYAGASLRSGKTKSVSAVDPLPQPAQPTQVVMPKSPIKPTQSATIQSSPGPKAVESVPAHPVVPVITQPKIASIKATMTSHPHGGEPTESLVEKALAGSSDDDEALTIAEVAPPTADLIAHPTVHDLAKAARPKRIQPVRTITLVGVGIVVILLSLLAYILPARAAAKALTAKLGAASSVHYVGTLQLTGSSFLSVLSSNLSFNGTYANKSANQFNYDGTFASRQYTGSFITSGSHLYSQMTGADLPFIRYNQGIATYHITPSDWYQTKADTSLYKYYCETKPDTKYPSPLIWYQAIRQVKLQPSPIIGYGAKIDGHSTTHLRGSIASKDLNTAWANINSSLPPGCEWNNQIEDLSGLDVKFDAYTSKDYDQIQLHLTDKDLGLTGTIVIKFDQYNMAPAVAVPTVTKNLADIFSGRAAIQARDYTRRADIDKLKVALDKYAAANKATPPSSLSKLAPKYIATVPKDPNGSDYKYAVSKKTYSLQATLEDAGQLYVVTGP